MIEEYRMAVQRAYQQKKKAGELSVNLTHPTCANIRNECLAKYRQGCNRTDLRMFQDFLERPNDEQLPDKAIKRCDTEKFKPLDNFLKKGIKTHERNIELLAWLIDFELRPSTTYYMQTRFAKKTVVNTLQVISKTPEPVVLHKPASNIHEHLVMEPEGIREQVQVDSGYAPQKIAGFDFQDSSPLHSPDRYRQQYATKLPERSDIFIGKRETQKQITIEYPSGAKVSVDTSDLSLIAQLVKL